MKLLSFITESEASDLARNMGLKHVGWGKYADKSGTVVAKSKDGKLVKVKGDVNSNKNDDNKSSDINYITFSYKNPNKWNEFTMRLENELVDSNYTDKLHDRYKKKLQGKYKSKSDVDEIYNASYLWKKESPRYAIKDCNDEEVVSERINCKKLVKKTIQKMIELCKSNSVTTEYPVYRGMKFKNIEDYKKFKNHFTKNKEIKLPPSGFSLNSDIAMEFTIPSAYTQIHNVFIRIHPVKNKIKGFYVNGISKKLEHEREIVCMGNYKAKKIVEHSIENGNTFLIIDLVEKENDGIRENLKDLLPNKYRKIPNIITKYMLGTFNRDKK